ncbi:MAG: hypothetical protein VX335_04360, partial [Pseudomonadota bacterium]|nr:hypothetical protein [Pseudomonadota bacterium]
MPQSSRNTLTGNPSFNLPLLLDHLERKNIKTPEEESLLATLTNLDNISHKNLYDLREYIKKAEGLPQDFKKNRVLNIINGIFREDLKSKLEALIDLVLADKQEVRARIASSSKGQAMSKVDGALKDSSESLSESVSKEKMEGTLKDLNKHIFFEDSGDLEVKVDDDSSNISLVSDELHEDILEELKNKYMGDKMRVELVSEAKDFLFPQKNQSSSIKVLPGLGGNPGGVLLFGGA